MKRVLFVSIVLAFGAILTSAFVASNKLKNADETTFHQTGDEPSKWVIDKSHSNVKFAVTHLVVSEMEGNFKLFEGTMENSKADFSDARISFTIDVNSINTENENRDKHLKGDDFFNAEKFPTIKFVSESFTPTGGNKYKLAGKLIMRDITKPIVFDVTYGGLANMRGKIKAGFKAKTSINRFDYNLKWNAATEAGGLVVGKDVDLVVNVEMNKQ